MEQLFEGASPVKDARELSGAMAKYSKIVKDYVTAYGQQPPAD